MTRGEYETWVCVRCGTQVTDGSHTCTRFLRQLARNTGRGLAVGLLVLFGTDFALTACDPNTSTTGATVTGTGSSGDKTKNGLTHYADCRAADGSEYRVIVTADVEYSLHAGQPCPGGPHVPTVRQQNPGLFDEISSALNAPLPYNGGDSNGPCWAWSAPDKTTADQLRAAYDRCMATHGGNR